MTAMFSYQSLHLIQNEEFRVASNVIPSSDYSKVFMIVEQNNNQYLLIKDTNKGNYTKDLLPNRCVSGCPFYDNFFVSEKYNQIYIETSDSYGYDSVYIYDLVNKAYNIFSIYANKQLKIFNDTLYYVSTFFNETHYSIDNIQTSFIISFQSVFKISSNNQFNFSINNPPYFDGNLPFDYWWINSNFSKIFLITRQNGTAFYLNYYDTNSNLNNNMTLISSTLYNLHSLEYLLSPTTFQFIKWDPINSLAYYSFCNNVVTTIYSFNLTNSKINTIAIIPDETDAIALGPNNAYIYTLPFNKDYKGFNFTIYQITNKTVIVEHQLIIQDTETWNAYGTKEIICNYEFSGGSSYLKLSILSYDNIFNTISQKVIINQISLHDEETILFPLFFVSASIILLMSLIIIKGVIIEFRISLHSLSASNSVDNR